MWRRWPAYRLVNMGREDDDAEMVRGISQLRDSLHSGYCAIHEYVTKGGERMVLVHKQIDQLRACLDSMIAIPSDRRMMISGWNPALLGTTALPSCPHTYNWSVHTERSELSLAISMGSTDLAGSLPSCVASGAALMAIVERLTGLKAKWLSVSMADAYLCQDQLEMVREQLRRIPKKAPTLVRWLTFASAPTSSSSSRPRRLRGGPSIAQDGTGMPLTSLTVKSMSRKFEHRKLQVTRARH